ncbi:unnamed protein product [Fusarium fujikuroi]|nr:uncharacterized protein FFC1_08399 [Fusarium fujikuroi]VTT83670.1 unnamed protein product [Fusarium fujikuroi]
MTDEPQYDTSNDVYCVKFEILRTSLVRSMDWRREISQTTLSLPLLLETVLLFGDIHSNSATDVESCLSLGRPTKGVSSKPYAFDASKTSRHTNDKGKTSATGSKSL